MLACENTCDMWTQFIEFIKTRCSKTAFDNWLAPIKVLESTDELIVLEVPNVFVSEYLLSNYKKELTAFLPINVNGEPAISFTIGDSTPKKIQSLPALSSDKEDSQPVDQSDGLSNHSYVLKLNSNYRFETFIEGPANQFVKSAAIGVANRPGHSYNPLFIHGGVGLGKTHILHSIGHHIRENHKKLRVQCITTEEFINALVDHLRRKSIDKMKQFYRADVDILLVDDIQFLQSRLNFEEEFCNTFEALINQNKQIVITSDKPPAQLKLSERMIARMEWGLVAHVGIPELETRVAIIQNKARQRGIEIPNKVAFFIAEHIFNNVRQLEGAINRLSAYCRLMNISVTEEFVTQILREMLQQIPQQRISVEQILKSVSTVFQVRVSDLKGTVRTKEIALPRQVAMYLACKMIKESLQMLGASFGKTHSTLLHACKSIEQRLATDDTLRRQISMVERNIAV